MRERKSKGKRSEKERESERERGLRNSNRERKRKGLVLSSVPFFLQLVESKGPIELHANTHMCQCV
jgi:hypothetical protein